MRLGRGSGERGVRRPPARRPTTGPRRELRGRGPGGVRMDLILDADGRFAWCRGPTAAPLLSLVGHRLLGEELRPAQGHSPRGHTDEDEDVTSPRVAGPGAPLDPAVSPGLIDPAVWVTTQFAAAQLGDQRRTARLVMLALQIPRDP